MNADTALAAHRVTRLIVADKLTEPARHRAILAAYRSLGLEWRGVELAERHDLKPTTPAAAGARADGTAWADLPLEAIPWVQVVAKDPHAPKLAYLLTCPWCVGMYVAGAVVVLDRRPPRWWPAIRRALAVSAAAGILAGWETP